MKKQRENIYNTLQKLHALSQSANPHDAGLAAAKMQSILFKHNLTIDQVLRRTGENDIQVKRMTLKRFDISWSRLLLSVIAEENFCQMLYIRGTNTADLIGKTHHIETVLFLHVFLYREIVRLQKKALTEDGLGFVSRFIFCRSFGLGAAACLEQRLREQRKQDEAQFATSEESKALVVLTDQEVREFVDKKYRVRPAQESTRPDSRAFQCGWKAGKSIPLQEAIKGDMTA